MENKDVYKIYTKIVDKFSAIAVAYENGLETEDKLKKNACSHIGTLTRLKEVDNLAVDDLIEEFTAIIKAEKTTLNTAIEKICDTLYTRIHSVKE